MFDELIIEEIRKRQIEKEHEERPFLELPIPEYDDYEKKEPDQEPKRVIVIDLWFWFFFIYRFYFNDSHIKTYMQIKKFKRSLK